jgi:hypothetical protein
MAVAILGYGIGWAPHAGAVDTFIIPIDYVATGDCVTQSGEVVTHEDVHLTGQVRVTFEEFVQNDIYHHIDITTYTGVSGVGLTTGITYRGVGTVTYEAEGTLDAQVEDTLVNTFQLVGPGPDNNLSLIGTFHVTVDANRVVRVDFVDAQIICR